MRQKHKQVRPVPADGHVDEAVYVTHNHALVLDVGLRGRGHAKADALIRCPWREFHADRLRATGIQLEVKANLGVDGSLLKLARRGFPIDPAGEEVELASLIIRCPRNTLKADTEGDVIDQDGLFALAAFVPIDMPMTPFRLTEAFRYARSMTLVLGGHPLHIRGLFVRGQVRFVGEARPNFPGRSAIRLQP